MKLQVITKPYLNLFRMEDQVNSRKTMQIVLILNCETHLYISFYLIFAKMLLILNVLIKLQHSVTFC
jgi:hypothetical protein